MRVELTIKMQTLYISIIFLDEVIIMLHDSNSNSKYTILTLQVIFDHFLRILFCDMHLVLIKHLTNQETTRLLKTRGAYECTNSYMDCTGLEIKDTKNISLLYAFKSSLLEQRLFSKHENNRRTQNKTLHGTQPIRTDLNS